MGASGESSETKMEERNKKKLFYDPMAVTWMEKYSSQMDQIWSKMPNFVGTSIATLAVFLLGATMRGKLATYNKIYSLTN